MFSISTLVPIIDAGVLCASSTTFSIKYIDSLFICVSGLTGTGLATVDLSALTPWQQVIIVIVSVVKSGTLPPFDRFSSSLVTPHVPGLCFSRNSTYTCADEASQMGSRAGV
jgi:hypothetical protein